MQSLPACLQPGSLMVPLAASLRLFIKKARAEPPCASSGDKSLKGTNKVRLQIQVNLAILRPSVSRAFPQALRINSIFPHYQRINRSIHLLVSRTSVPPFPTSPVRLPAALSCHHSQDKVCLSLFFFPASWGTAKSIRTAKEAD